jgi:hypothetical protein
LPVLDVTAFVPAVDFFAFPGGAFVCPGAPGWAGGLALPGGVVTGGLALPGGVLVAPGGVFVDPGGVRDSLVVGVGEPLADGLADDVVGAGVGRFGARLGWCVG